jgi:uncharacterized protein (TIGR03382 family)
MSSPLPDHLQRTPTPTIAGWAAAMAVGVALAAWLNRRRRA